VNKFTTADRRLPDGTPLTISLAGVEAFWMRSLGIALLTGVAVLAACGGGETPDGASTTPAVTPAESTSGPVTLSPITGTVHVVNMVGDGAGYRYEPSTITAKPGDGIRFVMVNFGPHNVAFDPAQIPAGQKEQLWANMGENAMDGSSPMMLVDGAEWTLSLGNLEAGTYPFVCTPHFAMSMKGEIIIR
jgi:plastocyanin